MLTFFRKIRRNLLNQNQVSKYILYAAGEIFLVMIGILLALQVNNWNENRKKKTEIKAVMESLANEFQGNINSIDIRMNRIKRDKQNHLYVLSLFGNSQAIDSLPSLDSLLEITFYLNIWKPSMNVLNDLTNSGKLTLIENEKLKFLLEKWKSKYDECEDWNRRLERSAIAITNYINENGSLRNLNHYRLSIPKSKFTVNHLRLLDDIKLENLVEQKAIYVQFQMEAYQDIRKTMEEIIEQANSYLEW